MTLNELPIVDFSLIRQDIEHFAADIGHAFQSIGFAAVTNHTLAPELIQRANSVMRTFFALPAEEKMRSHLPGIGGVRGYTPFGVETAKDSHHPDLKEFFQVGRETDELRAGMYANVWPALHDFRETLLELFQELDHIGIQILRGIAVHLDLPEYYFDHRVNHGNSILRPIHYPPISDSTTESVRSGQHEDINLITLLVGSEQPGLQILTRQQEWVSITSIPGAIVCNVGDMLQRLTNHVYVSTTHRVVNSEPLDKPRYSIPFFLHLNSDLLIETLPQCITDDRPNRYPNPITTDEYLKERLREIRLI